MPRVRIAIHDRDADTVAQRVTMRRRNVQRRKSMLQLRVGVVIALCRRYVGLKRLQGLRRINADILLQSLDDCFSLARVRYPIDKAINGQRLDWPVIDLLQVVFPRDRARVLARAR